MEQEKYKIRIQDKDTSEQFYNAIELEYTDDDFELMYKLAKKAMSCGYDVLIGIEE